MSQASTQSMVQRGEGLCLVGVKLGETPSAVKHWLGVSFVILPCNHSKGANTSAILHWHRIAVACVTEISAAYTRLMCIVFALSSLISCVFVQNLSSGQSQPQSAFLWLQKLTQHAIEFRSNQGTVCGLWTCRSNPDNLHRWPVNDTGRCINVNHTFIPVRRL